MKYITFSLLTISFFGFTACTSHEAKRAGYEILRDTQCMREAGYHRCDPERESFEEYEQRRKEHLEQ